MSRRVKTKITDQVPPIIFIMYTSKYDIWMPGVRQSVVGSLSVASASEFLMTFNAKILKIKEELYL